MIAPGVSENMRGYEEPPVQNVLNFIKIFINADFCYSHTKLGKTILVNLAKNENFNKKGKFLRNYSKS